MSNCSDKEPGKAPCRVLIVGGGPDVGAKAVQAAKALAMAADAVGATMQATTLSFEELAKAVKREQDKKQASPTRVVVLTPKQFPLPKSKYHK